MHCTLVLLLLTLMASPIHAIVVGDTLDFDIDDAVLDSEVGYVINADGFHLIDVSNPYRVEIIRTLRDGSASSLERDGDRLHVVESGGIRVYSIAAVEDPLEIGFVPGEYADIRVIGSLLASFDRDGIRLFDIESLSNPRLLSTIDSLTAPNPTFPFFRPAQGINSTAIEGPRLYVADSSTVRTFDITNPESPQEFPDRFGFFGTISEILARDSIVLIGGSQVRLYDFADPSNPTEVGKQIPNDFGGFRIDPLTFSTRQIEIRGNTLHTAGETGYQNFDITNLRAPEPGGIQFPNPPGIRATSEIYVGDNLVLFETLSSEPGHVQIEQTLQALDITHPNFPKVPRAFTLADWVVAAPPFVFAITSSGTIRVFDLSDPSQPAFVRTLDPPRNDLLVRGAALHDDVLFVLAIGRGGSPTGGLLVIDVSDPNNPQAGELIEIPNGAKSFAIAGDRLYIGVDALLTFDISTPIAPVEIGISPALDILEVAVDPVREQLFSVGVMTAQNFDISDPIAPVLLSQSNSGRGFGIAVAPPLLFISNLNSNFLSNVIRDVSDPSAPFLLSTLFERLNVFVEPSGSPQFVGDQLRVYQSGIRIFDVSSPRSPWPIGQVPTGGLNVVSLGRIVFAARPAVRRIDLGPEYEETKPVDIELRPRLDVNPVNPTSAGSLKVTLYGREDFNVADVRDMTLMLGPARGLVSQLSRRDSNRDGFDDIFLRVPIAETGISFGDARVCLRGRTLDGRPFRGCDAIRTPAIACGLGFEVVPFVVGLAALRRRRSRRV